MSSESPAMQRFVSEAREHLAGMTSAIMELERGEGSPQAVVERLLRAAHSIKGGAGFTGRRKIEQLAHAMETALESIRDGHVSINAEVIDTLLAVLDRILAMVDDAEHSDDADISALLARLRPLSESAGGQIVAAAVATATGTPATLQTQGGAPSQEAFTVSPAVLSRWQSGSAWLYGVRLEWDRCEREHCLPPLSVVERAERAGSVLESRTETTGPALSEGLPDAPLWWMAIMSSALSPEQFTQKLGISSATVVVLRERSGGAARAAGPPRTEKPAATTGTGSLRIPVRLIDRLVELAGELSLVRNQTARATDPANVALRRLTKRLDSVTNELQDAALRMRMQPVGTLFDRFPRLVRDLARQLGRQIELEITGSEVALDKAIIELLADPLTHLVRNACDHGIESPEQRAKAGKPATGGIKLSARQERGQIVIEVRDDGRGIDRDAVKRKAVTQGIKRSDELDRLSDRQIFDLILLSGFSTADRVTDLSGRGVGMDVVKTNLDQVGGVVEIDSRPGVGTVFNLRLPLTLAIVPCLLVVSGQRSYALPQRDVQEILLLGGDKGQHRIECSQDEELLRLRGQLLPVVRLAEVLGRRQTFDAQWQSRIIQKYHRPDEQPGESYAAVVRVGSRRFVLAFDRVIESESIVVKPLHPLLRPLGIYSGMAILGNGNVAMILSSEGVARHSGVMHRPSPEQAPGPAALPPPTPEQGVLLFRYGPSELLAIGLNEVRRVVMISRAQIRRVGDRELVDVDGTALNVLRMDRFLNLSPCPTQEWLFLILPRHAAAPVALLASEIVDAPMLSQQLDESAYKADGIAGSAMVRDQIALFLDSVRLVQIWQQMQGGSKLLPRGGVGKRVLVVEDTRFFQKLITSCLEGEGYQVEVAANGSEGLARLGVAEFDLIISDLEMPVMNGFEFARQVRADSRHDSMPMLALTTLNTAEHRAKASACGFDAYEVKLDRANLLKSVDDLLRHGRRAMIVQERGNA